MKDFALYTGIFFAVMVGYFSLVHVVPKEEQPDSSGTNITADDVKELTKALHFVEIEDLEDPDFSLYAETVLEQKCPFYEPDGVSYRECLSKLVANAKLSADKTHIRISDEYCQAVSAAFSGVKASNLYLSCMAYKLSAAPR